MAARRGQLLARVAAPLAFLVLAIIGIVAIRSAFEEAESAPPPAAGTTATTPREPPATTATTPRQTPRRRFYRVQSGDTLGSIAAEQGTTVERLQTLNPGVDPVALSVGQRIRVG